MKITEEYLSIWRGQITVHRPPTMAEIVEAVARKHGVTVKQLKGSGRARWIAHPRQEAMARMKTEAGKSTTAIGIFLGNRDHTTVIYGIRQHLKRSLNVLGCDQTPSFHVNREVGVDSRS